MNEPININEASFDRAVIQSPIPVVVDFWAPWCGPCKMIAPMLEEIAKESGGRFRVAKVNIDDDPALQQRFGIRGVPTLLFFSGGELRDQIVGLGRRKPSSKNWRTSHRRLPRRPDPKTFTGLHLWRGLERITR